MGNRNNTEATGRHYNFARGAMAGTSAPFERTEFTQRVRLLAREVDSRSVLLSFSSFIRSIEEHHLSKI